MKKYVIRQIYDDEEETDALQIFRLEQKVALFTVVAHEGDFLAYLKSKVQKEFIVHQGHFGSEYGRLKSKMGLSSSWKFEVDGKEIAKAEVKGIQYFTIKLKDQKKGFSGKTPNLDRIDLKEDKGISTCIKFSRIGELEKLQLEVEVDCKIKPEALLTFAIALDHKYVYTDN